MGKETKEKGKHRGKKITQFPTQSDVQEELEDAAMDRFLRQSIIEDADRIERELNEDPKLIGIGASDDLFGKIVEELKTKGIWEGDKETNVDERPEPAQEEQQKPAVYDMLSEADREAQERKEKRKKRNRRLKHVSAAVVALVLVGGIGLSTEASRRWIFQVGDVFLDSLGISIKNNFTEKEKNIRNVSSEEQLAERDIKEKLGIIPVEFVYLPSGMRFSFYETNQDALYAIMEYMYEEKPFTIQMWGNAQENVLYNQIDGDVDEKEEIITEQGIEVQVYEVEIDKQNFYKASFSYDDNYYYCKGQMDYSEMQKILKYLIVLEN